MQECDEFMSLNQSTRHMYCRIAFWGSLFDEESTPQFPPLMKSICSLPLIGLTLRMLMELQHEEGIITILIE